MPSPSKSDRFAWEPRGGIAHAKLTDTAAAACVGCRPSVHLERSSTGTLCSTHNAGATRSGAPVGEARLPLCFCYPPSPWRLSHSGPPTGLPPRPVPTDEGSVPFPRLSAFTPPPRLPPPPAALTPPSIPSSTVEGKLMASARVGRRRQGEAAGRPLGPPHLENHGCHPRTGQLAITRAARHGVSRCVPTMRSGGLPHSTTSPGSVPALPPWPLA